jgi:hypothetical protein
VIAQVERQHAQREHNDAKYLDFHEAAPPRPRFV